MYVCEGCGKNYEDGLKLRVYGEEKIIHSTQVDGNERHYFCPDCLKSVLLFTLENLPYLSTAIEFIEEEGET